MNINNNTTVLIVDDDKDISLIFSEFFQYEGYKVNTAHSGTEAFYLLNKNSIDLIVTDINMPEMNGIDFIHKVREINPYIPVIVVTGSYDLSVNKRLENMNIFEFLNKPVHMDALLNVVKNASKS
ncbi:MAG: response regulator [Thermodesulfobacteriota bacterium]|nr:response regulator [Thermodesulfobacteriota bacterium]